MVVIATPPFNGTYEWWNHLPYNNKPRAITGTNNIQINRVYRLPFGPEAIHDLKTSMFSYTLMKTVPGIFFALCSVNTTGVAPGFGDGDRYHLHSDDNGFFDCFFYPMPPPAPPVFFNYYTHRNLALNLPAGPPQVLPEVTVKVPCGPFVLPPAADYHRRLKNPSLPAAGLEPCVEKQVRILSVPMSLTSDLWKLFGPSVAPGGGGGPPIPDNNSTFFLVFDTGLVLLSLLRGAAQSLNIRNINITFNNMHSLSTWQDSFKKPNPGKSKYRTQVETSLPPTSPATTHCKINEWFCNHHSLENVAADDPCFLSKYAVSMQHSLLKSFRAVRETWRLTPTQAANVDNACDDNQKGRMRTAINVSNDAVTANLAAQRKRSGDCFALRMASLLPEICFDAQANPQYMKTIDEGWVYTNPPYLRDATHWREDAGIPAAQQTRAWFEARTYFVTGDIPAARFAIMCGVNTILVNTTTQLVTRFQFV
jgi:hypothetical protein